MATVFFFEPKQDGALQKLSLSLLAGIPQTFICKHQGGSKLCSLFCSLCTSVYTSHRYPSQLRWVQPKLEFPGNACPCFNAITSPTTSANLPDLPHLCSPSRPLHPTTDTRLPQLPPCRYRMKGGRALPHSGPSVWNPLPAHVGNVPITDTFKSAVRPYPSTPNFLNSSIRVWFALSLALSLSFTPRSLSLTASLCVCVCVCVNVCASVNVCVCVAYGTCIAIWRQL